MTLLAMLLYEKLFKPSSRKLEKTKHRIEEIKKELTRSFGGNKWWKANNEKALINIIRLEHLQIYKHQKIAMKYLQKLEDKISKK